VDVYRNIAGGVRQDHAGNQEFGGAGYRNKAMDMVGAVFTIDPDMTRSFDVGQFAGKK
jgi:hypothetical protein